MTTTTYTVYYKGKTRGKRMIRAENLEHAESICNEKIKSWTDIITKPELRRHDV